MLKKIALPVMALVMLLGLASPPAKAGVRLGVTIGPPVYTYPYSYGPDPYVDPYAYPGYYNYYAAPVYPYGYLGNGYRGVHRDFERHERFENRGHEFHGNSGGRAFRGGSAGGHRR